MIRADTFGKVRTINYTCILMSILWVLFIVRIFKGLAGVCYKNALKESIPIDEILEERVIDES